MKPLDKDELYQHLHGFLKTRGIELKDGSYAQGIQKSCHILAEAINLGHKGLGRAKDEMDKKLDQMRQVIHEKTAPKPPVMAASPTPPTEAATTDSPPAAPSPPKPAASKPKARKKGKGRRSRA
jgi:hypothetical protein